MEFHNLDPNSEKTAYVLKEDTELRFEVEPNVNDVYLELVSGYAEIFGSPLGMRPYKVVPHSKVAIFTWDGCTINIYGKVNNVYTSENSPMVTYFNLHAGLNERREKALAENSRGPRVVIAGPPGVGKSTLCKILVNYAAKVGWCPMLIDLDVSQNAITLPGAIGARPICIPADIEKGFFLDWCHPPIVFHFGNVSPESNVKFYDTLVQCLADSVNVKSDFKDVCNFSGAVINTSGWVQKEGYQSLVNVINVFEADVVVVLEHELLYQNLLKDVPDYVKVIQLPRPGGVFEVSQRKEEERSLSIRNYFYGITSDLFPHVFDVKFSDVQIFKVTAFKEKDVLLPLKMQEDVSVKLTPVSINNALQYHVLSTSYATSKEDDIIRTNISGFVVINKVDMAKQVLTLLNPQPRQAFNWNILLLIEGLTYQEA